MCEHALFHNAVTASCFSFPAKRTQKLVRQGDDLQSQQKIPVQADAAGQESHMMIHKVRCYKKYPFKQMTVGETFKLDDADIRNAQKMAYYYRALCKRPINIIISKCNDGHHCQRVA